MDAFVLENIQVKKSGKPILTIPSLAIAAGKKMAVVGPNGSGKSTFLRLLNLLEKPAAGRLLFFGEAADWRRNRLMLQRQMGFVFQKPFLFDRTVWENVALGLKFRGFNRVEIEKRVAWALALVGLQGYEKRQARHLSGGEAQRMALARVIVTRPHALLLDEATANLDPANVQLMEGVIEQIHRETETTVIMVTHNLLQAKRLADICLFIHNGQIVETADTPSFFSRPSNRELQDFLSGRMIY